MKPARQVMYDAYTLEESTIDGTWRAVDEIIAALDAEGYTILPKVPPWPSHWTESAHYDTTAPGAFLGWVAFLEQHDYAPKVMIEWLRAAAVGQESKT